MGTRGWEAVSRRGELMRRDAWDAWEEKYKEGRGIGEGTIR